MVLKKCMLIFAFVITFLCCIPPDYTYAASGIGITTEFDGLEGDARYLGQEYRNNYKLDTEKIGITHVIDQALYAASRVIFYVIKFLGFGTAAIFYYSMDFDLAGLLQPQIDYIQATLHDSVFIPLFQIAFIGALILAIAKYARRDFIGIMTQFSKVCFIIVLSVLVVRDSAKVLSYATAVTKSVSVSILTGVSGTDVGNNVDDYAKNAAAVLWISLVHEPWLTLEFGDYNYTDDDINFFLTVSDEEQRQERVEAMAAESSGPFKKDCNAERCAQGLIILLTMCVKCIVYIITGVMYFIFQVIAIFFVIMAPLILLLALIPGYDFEILGVWARKILETQIGVLLITFLIGMMIFCDKALQSLSQTIGWFTVLVLQIAVCVFLYLFRWQILMSLNSVQRGIQNPRLLKRQFLRAGNPYKLIERQYMFRQVRHAIGRNGDTRSSPAVENNSRYHTKFRKSRVRDDTVSRPDTRQAVEERYTAERDKTGESGIRGETYYAPKEVTDNWHSLWDNARPVSTERSSRPARRLALSQTLEGSEEKKVQRSHPEPQVISVTSESHSRPQTTDNMEHREVTRPTSGQRTVSKQGRTVSGNGAEAVKKTVVKSVARKTQENVPPERSYKAASGKAEASQGQNRPYSTKIEGAREVARPTSGQGTAPKQEKVVVRNGAEASKKDTVRSTAKKMQENVEKAASSEIALLEGRNQPHGPKDGAREAVRPTLRQGTIPKQERAVSGKGTEAVKKTVVKSAANKEQENVPAEKSYKAASGKMAALESQSRPFSTKAEGGKEAARPTSGQRLASSGKKESRNGAETVRKAPDGLEANRSQELPAYKTSKMAGSVARDVQGTEPGKIRPARPRTGEVIPETNNTAAARAEMQNDKKGIEARPVAKPYPGRENRHDSSTVRSKARGPVKTPPKVQNAAINGSKVYKGSLQRDVEKRRLK